MTHGTLPAAGSFAVGRSGRALLRLALPPLGALVVLQAASAQQGTPPEVVRPIEAGSVALPREADSATETRFSFIAYGDTRSADDGRSPQARHSEIVDRIIAEIPLQRAAGFPVRFIVQSGDAVQDGRIAAQWNVSFVPVLNRLIRETGVPYFFAVGNHDLDIGNRGQRTVGDPDRDAGLRNTAGAMDQFWPPEGTPRRLTGYPTFAFGYGHYFVIAIDSNIAFDDRQLAWVTNQLETLDRRRFPHVVAVFHHPVLTSGRHGGPQVEPQSELMRRRYMPLFRRHHVRMTITGHDHFYDHWIERYADAAGGRRRIDHIVSGGGGAPPYVYRGEQDLEAYAATAAPQAVQVEHVTKPGTTEADNPHHFLVADVDRDRMWVRVVTTAPTPFRPYQTERVELRDLVPAQ